MRFKKILFSVVIAFMWVFLSPSIALANEVESIDEALEEFLSHFDLDLVRNILGTDFDVDLTEYNTPRDRWLPDIRTRFIIPHGDISVPSSMRHHETSENDRVRTRRGDIILVLRGVSGKDPFLAFDVGSGSRGRNRIYEWFSLGKPNQENIDAFNEIAAGIQPHMDTIRSVVGVDFELIPHVFVSGQSYTAFDHRWRNNERWIFLDFGRNELDVDYFHSEWDGTGSNAHSTNLGEAFILERPRGRGFELALRIDVGMQRNPVDRWHRGYFQYVLR